MQSFRRFPSLFAIVTLALLVAAIPAVVAQAPHVKGVFSGDRPHVPNPANPVAVTPYQPSDKAAPRVVLDTKDLAGIAARVDVTLRKFILWGLNPKGVTLDSFEVEFYILKGDSAGGVGVPDRPYLRLTWPGPPPKSGEFDVELIARYGAYPTAVEALHLTEPTPKE